MSSDTVQEAEKRDRQLRVVAGIIFAISDRVSLTWFTWLKGAGTGHLTFLPTRMLPSMNEVAACDDFLINEIRSSMLSANRAIHLSLNWQHELWLPSWSTPDGKKRRLSPVLSSVPRFRLPTRVRKRFPDRHVQRAISLGLENIDLDFLCELGGPDPETTERVVSFTERIAACVGEGATIGSPSDCAWACDVTHGSEPAVRHFVEGCSCPPTA